MQETKVKIGQGEDYRPVLSPELLRPVVDGLDLLEEVKAEIAEAGFETSGNFGIRDIVPCVGTTYCPKAVTKTRDMYDLLMEVAKRPKYEPIQKKVIINITGCPNSCSPYRIADIGLRGTRLREELGSVEGYEIRIGGHHDRFGLKVGDYKEKDCPKVVEKILDTYLEVREGDETLSECVSRLHNGSGMEVAV